MMPIVSEETGYTLEKQPILRWYISSAWPGKIEFTILENRKVEPLVETFIDGPENEGIYEIKLADYNIILKPDIEYEWYLAIIFDPNERSSDFLASATLMYIPQSNTLSDELKNISQESLYFFYADHGYWYDAIENISQLIQRYPNNMEYKNHRIKLLEQVKLNQVAEFERKTKS